MGVMDTEHVIHMNGGNGEKSYAKNSLLQRKAMVRAKPMLEESVKKMYCKSSVPVSCFRVADLGCSSGPNTLIAAGNIVAIVDEASEELKVETPIFQIFLNDLFGNDFNSVFRSFPEFYHILFKQQHDIIPKYCFVNATPGSFHGRLYPSNFIHFFHSSYSLHWLSQVPKGLNNDKCHLEQFKKDFGMFLRSRSQELVSGGAMLLTFIGSYDSSQSITTAGLIHLLLAEMVSQNLIGESKLDGFSIPNYYPTAEEVREIIKEEGSFSVERMKSMRTSWDGSSLDDEDDDEEDGSDYDVSFVDDNERGESIAKYIRAVMESILKAHFGEEEDMMMIDELFMRFQSTRLSNSCPYWNTLFWWFLLLKMVEFIKYSHCHKLINKPINKENFQLSSVVFICLCYKTILCWISISLKTPNSISFYVSM